LLFVVCCLLFVVCCFLFVVFNNPVEKLTPSLFLLPPFGREATKGEGFSKGGEKAGKKHFGFKGIWGCVAKQENPFFLSSQRDSCF
jgi:hypothetical protein